MTSSFSKTSARGAHSPSELPKVREGKSLSGNVMQESDSTNAWIDRARFAILCSLDPGAALRGLLEESLHWMVAFEVKRAARPTSVQDPGPASRGSSGKRKR